MSNESTNILLMQNVLDLRRRLQETEKSLKGLKKLQVDDNENEEHEDMRRFAKTVSYRDQHGPQTMQDLLDNPEYDWAESAEQGSVKSGISTLPDSSYAGFSRRQVPSSTPNRQQTAVSRISKELREHVDVDSVGQLSSLKDANKKMLNQNHRLLSEVEKLSYDLQGARAKVIELSKEVDSYREMVPDLEDKVASCQAENDSHDRALRDAEERYDCCQYELVQVQKKMKESKEELDEIRLEITEEKKLRKITEKQRDESLQNFLEAQDTLEVYQRKTKERIKKLEENEDHLRDSLSHGNREREELLDKISGMQEQLNYQAAEIRKLEEIEDAENENKNDMEQQQMDLRSQVSKLSSKLSRLEPEAMLTESLKRENTRLKSKIERQNEQLSTCQQEIEESRTMLVQLEQIAHQVQQNSSNQVRRNSVGNDSGVHSHDSGPFLPKPSRDNSWHEEAAAEVTKRSPSSLKDILSDLRMKIALKDAEIHQLKATLQSAETSQQNSMLENIRTELTVMLDRSQSEDGRSRDLETTISRLEADRNKMAGNLSSLNRDLLDKESQNSALEARIEQRNAQLIDLQEQINHKCTEISNLEREVRKKTSQINSLEEQLDDKTSDITAQLTRMKELEDDAFTKEDEIQKLDLEVRELQKLESVFRVNIEESRKIHQEQCKDYEKQIDLLQDQVERKKNHLEELERQLNNLRHDLSNKNIELQHQNKVQEDLKEEFRKKSLESKDALQKLEIQATNGSTHVRQLESTLLLCKEEIKSYMDTLEESKNFYDNEISYRDKKILESEKQVQTLRTDLSRKEDDVSDLQKLVTEQQEMLKQSTNRIGELEQHQADLQQQTSHLEKQLVKQNSKYIQEIQSLEKKLHNACEDMERQTMQVRDLTQALKQLQQTNDDLTREVNTLDNQLQEEQDVSLEKTSKLKKMERELRDLRVEVEQKIESVADLEDKLRQKDIDFEHREQLVKDMGNEIKRLELTSSQKDVYQTDMEKQLQHSLLETKARDEMIEDLRDALRRVQDELNQHKREGDELRVALDERQRDLQHRVSQVGQLDLTIKEHQQIMEQKVNDLELDLKRRDKEVQDRSNQISDLDDKLQTTQSELKEKSLMLTQAEQLTQKIQLEVQMKTDKLEEFEKVIERQKERIEEQKTEMAETTQQLRLTREQSQYLHSELTSTRRELAHSHREQDKMSRELEENIDVQQNKNTVQERLEVELSSTKVKASETEANLFKEIDSLKQEMEKMKKEHLEQLGKNRDENSRLMNEKEHITKQLEEKLELWDKKGNLCMERLENSLNDVDKYKYEAEKKGDALRTADEQLVLKDAEIVRLQTRISVLERAAHAMKASASLGQLNTDKSMSNTAAYFNGNTGHVHLRTAEPFEVVASHPKNTYSEDSITQPKTLLIDSISPNLSECSMEMTGSNISDVFSTYPKNVPSAFETLQASHFGEQENMMTTPSSVESFQKEVIHVPDASFLEIVQEPETLDKKYQDMSDMPDYSQARRFARTIPLKSSNKQTSSLTNQPASSSQKKTEPGKKVKSNVVGSKRILNITSDEKFISGMENDPITAVNVYQTPETVLAHSEPIMVLSESVDQSHEGSMIEVHERLKENEKRQQEIERQLQSLEDENVQIS